MGDAFTAIGGAGSGAALGTAVAPGIGTIIGAVGGGILGAFQKKQKGISGDDLRAVAKEQANAQVLIAGINAQNEKRKTEIRLAIVVGVVMVAGAGIILFGKRK